MTSPAIRQAVDAAVCDLRKPLADLTPDEVELLYDRTVFHFILQNARRGRRVVVR